MKKELREEFWHAFEKSPFIMIRLDSAGGHAEPMTAQLDRDALHTIWFFASRTNRIAAGGRGDPDLMMLRFEVDEAEVWTVDPGVRGTFKMLTGSAIRSSEMGEHAVGLV